MKSNITHFSDYMVGIPLNVGALQFIGSSLKNINFRPIIKGWYLALKNGNAGLILSAGMAVSSGVSKVGIINSCRLTLKPMPIWRCNCKLEVDRNSSFLKGYAPDRSYFSAS
jgi:hypothetical protein